MLTIKCAGCKRKLWKYDKIGHGEVLRCHKARITKIYQAALLEETLLEKTIEGKITCPCGKEIGIDKGSAIKMIGKSFIYTGTKRNS